MILSMLPGDEGKKLILLIILTFITGAFHKLLFFCNFAYFLAFLFLVKFGQLTDTQLSLLYLITVITFGATLFSYHLTCLASNVLLYSQGHKSNKDVDFK